MAPESFQGPLRQVYGPERMLGKVTERLGPVDILVNNAGVCYHRPAAEMPRDDWLNTFDINVHGLWYRAQTVGKQMIEGEVG
jgi:NAD(P)-dependent dehydrogenase (short-subunit alcohol dehydrogenase family)